MSECQGISNDNIDGDWCYLSNVEVVALTQAVVNALTMFLHAGK